MQCRAFSCKSGATPLAATGLHSSKSECPNTLPLPTLTILQPLCNIRLATAGYFSLNRPQSPGCRPIPLVTVLIATFSSDWVHNLKRACPPPTKCVCHENNLDYLPP